MPRIDKRLRQLEERLHEGQSGAGFFVRRFTQCLFVSYATPEEAEAWRSAGQSPLQERDFSLALEAVYGAH